MSITLQQSVLAIDPTANLNTLEELVRLVEKYNIKWVSNSSGKGAFFVMPQLSVAKGLDKEDYRRNWALNSTTGVQERKSNSTTGVQERKSNSTTSEQDRKSQSLPGKGSKIEGDRLKTFKALYLQTTGESLGRAPSLWVGDWLHAYSYLVQGLTDTAKDFQQLGANSIQQEVDRFLLAPSISPIKPESHFHQKILDYTNFSTRKFISEYRYLNPYSSSDGCKSRRTDLIELTSRSVRVWELKVGPINLDHIMDTLFLKQYLSVVHLRFPDKPIDFRFTSPHGITPQAQFAFDIIGSDYKTIKIDGLSIRYKITYQSTQDLALEIYQSILNITPPSLHWQIDKHLNADYLDILPVGLLASA